MDWRREFNRWAFALGLSLLTGAAAAAAPAAEAEARFATIAPGPSECPATPAGAAFLKAFRDLGYAKDPVIDARCFSQPDDIPRLVAEVLARKPPLVVVWGSIPAVHLLRQSAPATPVIFVNVADPVQYGLVQSLSRPGGNITGIAKQIIALALAHRLPMMSYTVTFSDAGGLFVYAASLDDMSYRAAAYVDKVLKGARPADIPVQLPEKFEGVD